MKRRDMFHQLRVPMAALAAGLLVSALLTSGVLALLSDSVQIVDGEVTSASYTDPGDTQLNLEVATAPSSISCDGAVYQPDDVVSSSASQPYDTELDLTAAIEGGTAPSAILSRFCIRHATGGEFNGALTITLLSLSSSEIGSCNTTELAAETALGTPTCTAGEAGELASVISLVVQEGLNEPGQCDQVHTSAANAVFGPADVGTTKPLGHADDPSTAISFLDGGECLITIRAVPSATATADQLKAAVTDRVNFEFAINLVDPAA
ncbi:MAG: hypothetical protein GY708_10180 [Actinomycetia bacterium]|nr:hypothetical protein [Actinomycetes bacterium]